MPVVLVARSSNDAVSEWTRSAIKQKVIEQVSQAAYTVAEGSPMGW